MGKIVDGVFKIGRFTLREYTEAVRADIGYTEVINTDTHEAILIEDCMFDFYLNNIHNEFKNHI
jgi:hypothetical protein